MLQIIRLLQHPRLHVKRTLLLRLQPAINAMSMEGMTAGTPRNLHITRISNGHLTISLLSRIHLRLTVNAKSHQFATTDSASVHIGIPRPHHHGVPLFHLESSSLVRRSFYFHLSIQL